MARRKAPNHTENHERWLVSYADFMTLLFAFFVVMFANSQSDKGRAKEVSEAVKRALETSSITTVVAAIMGGAPDMKGPGNAQLRGPGGYRPKGQAEDLSPSLNVLSVQLKDEIQAGAVQVSMQPRGLTISFRQAALFPSGGDEITPQAYESIAKVASAIRKIPNPVRLEGHTDSKPIHTARFPSNWDLSAARSIALLGILTEQYDVPPERFSIAGYADTAPVASNDSDEGRSQNRRVDIVILNEIGKKGEPERYGK